MQAIIGQKVSQSQKFLEDGTRIPVTAVSISGGNVVVQTKTADKEGYSAIQLGFGSKKKANEPLIGHAKKASLNEASLFLREVAQEGEMPAVGTVIKASDVLKPGDIVDVIGISKGKGYAGGVKRYHFKGGPRTHGQSDRERAPGSIGQSTTPGRVYRGKKMAGRMGHGRVTISNLQVVEVTDDGVLIKGLVPGPINNLIMIKKVGEAKKFKALYKEQTDEPEVVKEKVVEAPVEEVVAEPAAEEQPEVTQTEGESGEAGSRSAGEVKENAS